MTPDYIDTSRLAREAEGSSCFAALDTLDEPGWKHIAFAPRDGRKLRIKTDECTTHAATFSAPHWWVVGNGAGRIADDVLYDNSLGDIIRAVQFKEI